MLQMSDWLGLASLMLIGCGCLGAWPLYVHLGWALVMVPNTVCTPCLMLAPSPYNNGNNTHKIRYHIWSSNNQSINNQNQPFKCEINWCMVKLHNPTIFILKFLKSGQQKANYMVINFFFCINSIPDLIINAVNVFSQ